MEGDALSQALALRQNPMLRFSLRSRPLAPDILVVIKLAAGSQPLLSESAERLGLREAELLEAARFHLQQVLFEGEPDAYRILAATPETPHEDIRTHARWLQRWLHPDRNGEDWESLFASRVNWAWSQLRNESARAHYDTQSRDLAPTSTPPQSPRETGGWKPVPLDIPPRSGTTLRSVSLGMMALVCAGLLYLAISREYPAGAPSAPAPRLAYQTTTHADADATERAPRGEPAQESAALSHSNANEPETLATHHIAEADNRPSSEAGNNAHSRDTPATGAASATSHDPHASAPLSTRTVAAEIDSPKPSAGQAPATPETPATVSLAPSRRAATPRERIATAPPAAAVGAPDRPRTSRRSDAAVAANTSSTAAPAPPPPPIADSTPALATVPSDPAPVTEPSSFEVPPDSSLAPASPLASEGDLTPIGTDPTEMLTRMEIARVQIDTLAAYFQGQDVSLSNGPDAFANTGAEASRAALRERAGTSTITGFELESPFWRMSSERVDLEAAYRAGSGHGNDERGLLRVGMQWNDQAWRFVRVELEPFR